MSKLKNLMSVLSEVKQTQDKNAGFFNVVPDSIENHPNNTLNGGKGPHNQDLYVLGGVQKKTKSTSPGKKDRYGSNVKSPNGRHGNSDLNINKRMSKDRSPGHRGLSSFDD